MVIAVDIRDPLQAKDLVFKGFITETLRRIAVKNPGHHFVFIVDKGPQDQLLTGNNTEQVVAGWSAANPLFRKYWLNVQLPALLKKKGVALLITTNGSCSPGVKLPQYILLPGVQLLHKQGSKAAIFLQKADHIICFSEQLREAVIRNYKVPAVKTALLKAAASSSFKPLPFEEKQAIKNKYSAGKEYFVYTGMTGTASNLLNLLKAFSLFKKRQQSGFKLLLAGEIDKKDKVFAESLATYKYREDLVLAGPVTSNEKARLVAAAYALVDPSLQEGTGIPALEAAASDVPVIAAAGQPLLEKETFLAADTSDFADIAAQMMLLYKDETLRNQLIEKARTSAKLYNTDRSADGLWELIMKTMA